MGIYTWKLGDRFSNGEYTWEVVSIHGNRAILQSLTTEWARTIFLTYEEWNDKGQWTLVEKEL